MACPVCPTTGWIGGWIGGYLGINPPDYPGGKLLSAILTANLISITVIALKSLCNISLCKGGSFTLENIFRVGVVTLPMGIVYSIGVNYFLNRYIYLSHQKECLSTCIQEDDVSSCCCSNGRRDDEEGELPLEEQSSVLKSVTHDR